MNNCYSIQDEHMNLTTRRVTQYTQQQDYQLPHNQDCKYSSKRNENNSKQEKLKKKFKKYLGSSKQHQYNNQLYQH
jgi:hypothetical protein